MLLEELKRSSESLNLNLSSMKLNRERVKEPSNMEVCVFL